MKTLIHTLASYNTFSQSWLGLSYISPVNMINAKNANDERDEVSFT